MSNIKDLTASHNCHKRFTHKPNDMGYIRQMKTQPQTQAEHFALYGYYSHMMTPPTKAEALQHAMDKIERAFGKKN